MQTYDIIMLTVLLAATAFGAWKGLAWQLASIGSVVLSYVVAYRCREPVAEMIDAAPPWNTFVAMLALYLATSLLIWISFQLVRTFISQFKLKEFDRQIGAVVGLAKGALLCMIITMFAVTLLGPEVRRTIVESRSGYYIAIALDRAHVIMPEEVHQVVGPYLHDFGDKLAGPENLEYGAGGLELPPASMPGRDDTTRHLDPGREPPPRDYRRDIGEGVGEFLRERVDVNFRLRPDDRQPRQP